MNVHQQPHRIYITYKAISHLHHTRRWNGYFGTKVGEEPFNGQGGLNQDNTVQSL